MTGEPRTCAIVAGGAVSDAEVSAALELALSNGAGRLLCEGGPVAEALARILAAKETEDVRLEPCVPPCASWPESADRVHVVPGLMARYLAKECDLVVVAGAPAPAEVVAYARAYGKTVLNAPDPP